MPDTPLVTRDITVLLSDAGGILRPGMTLIATLSVQDTDGDRVVQVLPVETTITEDGATLNLWPTTRGLRGGHYRITARMTQEIVSGRAFAKEIDVGRIQPDDIDGQVLGDLLNVMVPPETLGWYVTLPRDDYDAQTDLIEAIAVQTAADRVQTGLDREATGADRAAVQELIDVVGSGLTTWVVYAGETDISVTLSAAPEVIVSETAETVVMEFV